MTKIIATDGIASGYYSIRVLKDMFRQGIPVMTETKIVQIDDRFDIVEEWINSPNKSLSSGMVTLLNLW